MKKMLFLTMVLALSTSVASAALVGVWIPETIGGGLSRYTLQVSSDAGVMTGFDIMVTDPAGSMVTGAPPTFSTLVNADTHFLFQKSHVVPPLVNDLAVAVEYEDNMWLMGAFTATAGGIYAAGFTNPVNVLQVVLNNPELVNAYQALDVNSTGGLPRALGRVGTGSGAVLQPITIVPEPASVLIWSLLGLVGVAAWIRRR